MDREASIKLLSTILADTVQLPGAACLGKHHLFDPVSGTSRVHRHQEQQRVARAAPDAP